MLREHIIVFYAPHLWNSCWHEHFPMVIKGNNMKMRYLNSNFVNMSFFKPQKSLSNFFKISLASYWRIPMIPILLANFSQFSSFLNASRIFQVASFFYNFSDCNARIRLRDSFLISRNNCKWHLFHRLLHAVALRNYA